MAVCFALDFPATDTAALVENFFPSADEGREPKRSVERTRDGSSSSEVGVMRRRGVSQQIRPIALYGNYELRSSAKEIPATRPPPWGEPRRLSTVTSGKKN